jgi:hypothetical protein
MSTDPRVSTQASSTTPQATLVRVLRAAIEHLGRRMPEVEPALRRTLLRRYRDAEGEQAATPYSRAKADLIEHLAAFRSQYPRVLAGCLQSQFHRLAGHPGAWPDPDGDVDAPARPHTALIDGLCRRVPLDGPGGLLEFDRRLCLLLGRSPAGVPANPVRPAVFFHAVGLCWARVAGTDRDELDVIRDYGRQLLPTVASIYPLMLAMLPASAPPRLERLAPPAAAHPGTPAPADARTPAPTSAAPLAAEGVGEPSAVPALVMMTVDMVAQLFEPVLADERLPVDVRFQTARLQLAALRAGLQDARVFSDLRHPARRLLDAIGDPDPWRTVGADVRLARLVAIAEAAQGGEHRFDRLLATWDRPAEPAAAEPPAPEPIQAAPEPARLAEPAAA